MLSGPGVGSERRTVAWASRLDRHGDSIALLDADGQLTYADLAARVAARGAQLGPRRRLLLLAMRNETEAIVWYLAALATGNPVILVDADNTQAIATLRETYNPDVVVQPTAQEWRFEPLRAESAHDLHPELALMLSTSGSTGAPKLVRLSQDNLESNAASIATYLQITAADRAVTTLPLHYCYGLSVLHSYLLRGASLIVTNRSVVEPEFWHDFRALSATSLAGVPYTFELLDQVGFAHMDLPSLRYVTQAGGKMPVESVRRYARLGKANGWELVVMYGQTEATARMAYLPPDKVLDHPQAIGVPVPGGEFRIEPVDGQDGGGTQGDVGELVYLGPNVMLGYATSAADFASGRTVHELRTGDLARLGNDGLVEVVGRRSRFVKAFGLRIDLHQVECVLAEDGVAAHTGADGEHVVVAVAPGERKAARHLLARATKLPPHAFTVVELAIVPRLPNGKIDYPAIVRAGRDARAHAVHDAVGNDVRQLFAEALGLSPHAVSSERSFVDLGGNSLTYVRLSAQLERTLGHLPKDWHTVPVGELGATARPAGPARRLRPVETGIVLRAVAIVMIVSLHIGLFDIPGGAHLLLGIAGYNAARFILRRSAPRSRVSGLLRCAAGVAAPAMAWIAVVLLTSDYYSLSNLLLVSKFFGPHTPTSGHLWFVEALVAIVVLTAGALAIPAVGRLAAAQPFWFPVALTGAGVAGSLWAVQALGFADAKYTVLSFWFFTAGWAAAQANTRLHLVFVSVLVVLASPWFFDDRGRAAVAAGALLLLFWVPTLRLPGTAVRLVGLLAGASLSIYITHWQVFPVVRAHVTEMTGGQRIVGEVAALAAVVVFGVALHHLVGRLGRRLRGVGSPRPAPTSVTTVHAAPQPPQVGPRHRVARRALAGMIR